MTESLSSFSKLSVTSPMSQLILQPFFCFSYVTSSWLNSPGEPAELIFQAFSHFTYVMAHSPTLSSLNLHHSSFSNLSVASPMSQLILQPFFCFSYVTSSSFNSPGEPTELILQAFSYFIYVTAHSPTLPLLYLHQSSFSNPCVASPMSQLIPQPFFRFSYITGFSLMSPGEPPMHSRVL